MASDGNNHGDESSPLLENQEAQLKSPDLQRCEEKAPSPPLSLPSPPPPCKPSVPLQPETNEWTSQGVPVGRRTPWLTGLTHCIGCQEAFCSTDLEVCLLGCFAPCVLYGSNVERLGLVGSAPRDFTSHCTAYSALCLIGCSFFGWNILAPLLSHNSRTDLRRRFNLEGTCESVTRSLGCCECFVEDEELREHFETACDNMTHITCHMCALCQEGREIRRRIPHPTFTNQTAFVIYPPGEQTMVRDMP